MGPRVKKKTIITKTTLAKLALYASGFVVDTSSTNPSIVETELQRNNYTDLTGQLNVTTAVALANTQRPAARHVSSITLSHQLHTALIFDKQNCISLLMYVGCLSLFFSVLKEKCVKPCGKSRDVLLFALQTLTSLLYFFLLEKSSWLLYIVIMLMMNMITYLLAVKGALLACLCVHERSVDSMTEGRRM